LKCVVNSWILYLLPPLSPLTSPLTALPFVLLFFSTLILWFNTISLTCQQEGRIELPPQDDDVLLRVDFVREVDELLKEVQAEQEKNKQQTGYDPESVAMMLKQQEKLQVIRQVESLLELAGSLKW
jgi:hypothetical protein